MRIRASVDQRAKGRWPRRELVLGAGAVVVGLWLAWSIISNTAADTLVRIDAEAALSWRSDTAAALLALAGDKLAADDRATQTDAIGALAARALSAAPLQQRALAVLGAAAEVDGDQARADQLMGLAAERSRRDALVQIWSFYRQTRLGDFGAAVEHADAVLRSRPYLQAEIAPTLIAFAIDAEARQALLQVFADDPPWRSWYLSELAKQTEDPGIVYAVLADLREGPHPPSSGELLAYLQNLIVAGQFEQAYLTWINFLPDERRSNIRYAYNGDFEYPLSGLPFDWTIGAIAGASTDIVTIGADDVGHAVRIEFANRRVPYRHLRKLMMLPPGRYQLSGLARAQELVNERGLVWQVTCAESDGGRLGESEPVKGTSDWHRFSLFFSVPQTGCRAQWLTLALAAKAALEEQIGGVVWFDELIVSRAGPDGDGVSASN